MSTIHLASDHAGFNLKSLLTRHLEKSGHKIVDHGTDSEQSCDYPDYAHALCQAVATSAETGILVCGTGIGMSMAANRHPEIRAALCASELAARLCRQHNNANVLCLGARVTGEELALAIVDAFLSAGFEGGRHERRISKISL